MIAAIVLVPLAAGALFLGLAAERYYHHAKQHRAHAAADLEAARRVHNATAEHVRAAVLRKPYDVAERPRGSDSPLSLLINDNGRMVSLPIPHGSHPVFGRVPRGVS